MKNLYYQMFAVLFAAIAILFVACTTNDDPKGQKIGFYSAEYWGDYHKNGGGNFSFMFTADSLTIVNDQCVGDGEIVLIDLNAASFENLFPIAATMPINSSRDKGTALAGGEYNYNGVTFPSGCYVQPVVGGKMKTPINVIDGSVKVSGSADNAQFILELTLTDKTTRSFVYKGKVVVDDKTNITTEPNPEKNYDLEPKEVVTLNEVMTKARVSNFDNYYGHGSDGLRVNIDSDTHGAGLMLWAPLGSKDPYGEYIINDTYAVGTCEASPGGDDMFDYYSYAITDKVGSNTYQTVYYLVSGTVKLEKGKITLNAKSYNGSSINFTYEGDYVMDDGSDPAPSRGLNVKNCQPKVR